MGVHAAQFNAILWTVWGQGTGRLVWERPNGDVVTDQDERLWRHNALQRRPEDCPHWPAYRACAEPLVTDVARQQFAGQSDEDALLLLFRQLQSQPATVVPVLRRVSQNADLDRIVEADVWPWLERGSAAREVSHPSGVSVGNSAPLRVMSSSDSGSQTGRTTTGARNFGEQVAPLATIAYRLHELGTQVAHLARHGASGGAALDEQSVQVLVSCASILLQHSAYSRSCAVQVRGSAVFADQVARAVGNTSSVDTTDHQWWTDLTTRPITSEVRDPVAAVTGTAGLSALLVDLADESDVLVDELGVAFERVGWNRVIASGASCVGPELRSLSKRLSTTGGESLSGTP